MTPVLGSSTVTIPSWTSARSPLLPPLYCAFAVEPAEVSTGSPRDATQAVLRGAAIVLDLLNCKYLTRSMRRLPEGQEWDRTAPSAIRAEKCGP
jgi:hypothetical protein